MDDQLLQARITRTTRKIRLGEPDEVTVEEVSPLVPAQGIVPLGEIDTSQAWTRYEVSFEIDWPQA
jgi:hypothetical protein